MRRFLWECSKVLQQQNEVQFDAIVSGPLVCVTDGHVSTEVAALCHDRDACPLEDLMMPISLEAPTHVSSVDFALFPILLCGAALFPSNVPLPEIIGL